MAGRNVALVPLRGGSKAIPGKNIKIIGERPLCAWVLDAAVNAARIAQVCVSTDDQEIKEVVTRLDLGIRIIDRPAELATDEASTESVMLHFLEHSTEFDRLVTIQATSPLLEGWQLDEALERYETEQYDSMLSVVRTKAFFWNEDGTPVNYDPMHRPRRQDCAGTLMENGAFYITNRALLARSRCRLGGRVGLYEMPPDTAIEIDDPTDWDMVEQLLKNRAEQGDK